MLLLRAFAIIALIRFLLLSAVVVVPLKLVNGIIKNMIMRKIISIIILLLSITAYSQLPYNEGFESISSANTLPTGMTSSSLGTNCLTYLASNTYNRTPHAGSKFASFKYGSNDWFYTPGLALTGGVSYQFSVWYITDGATGISFEAKYGTSASSAAMTGTITGASVTNPTNTSYTQLTGTFTPATTATYYIGLHGTLSFTPWYLTFDDIEVKAAASNMSYVSCTTTQNNTSNVSKGTTNNEIIGLQIVTTGSANPLSVSSFTFSIAGSTAASTDITNARLWSSGTSSSFSTVTQLGNVVASPNGSFTISSGTNLPFGLSEGTNYFWLTYDVPSGAITGHVVDAQCASVTVGGTAQSPTVTAPSGSRPIVAAPPPVNCDSYNGAFNVSSVGYLSTGTYHQEYVLVNSSTNTIVAINNTGSFSGAGIGGYYIYAVNYEGLRPAQLSVGNSWATVVAYDAVASNCIDLSTSYQGRVLYVCNTDSICEPNSIDVKVKNNNTASGYQTYYILVRGLNIIASNTTGLFTLAQYGTDGLFNIYVVNTNNASVINEITNLGPWADVPALAASCCMDVLGPRAYFVSDIAAASCTTLPVELISFESSCVNDQQSLTWKTASEENNAYFSLEKSIDGTNFSSIAIIPGAGNSNSTISYSAVDREYTNMCFYRLAQTDFDGSTHYSDIIGSSQCVSAYRYFSASVVNTENSFITVQFSSELEELTSLVITDELGQTIYRGESYKGDRKHEVPFNLFSNRSVYFFHIQNTTTQFLIKHVL